MHKLSENYKVLHELNLIISSKLIITYNLYIHVSTSKRVTRFSLLYYYPCIFIVNKTNAGLAKIILDMFVDEMSFLLLPRNNF